MYLEKATVINFRGIRKLSVDFEESSTVLIGENQWGKSSLLRALWSILGKGDELCQFDKSDLYIPVQIDDTLSVKKVPTEDLVGKVIASNKPNSRDHEKNNENKLSISFNDDNFLKASESDAVIPSISSSNFLQELEDYLDEANKEIELEGDVFSKTDEHIHIDLFFRESTIPNYADKQKVFAHYKYYDSDGQYRIHWQIIAATNKKTGEFETRHYLVNKKNEMFKYSDELIEAIKALIRYNPVFRLRDSRMDRQVSLDSERGEKQKFQTISNLLTSDSAMTASYVGNFVNSFGSFFDKHLTSYAQDVKNDNVEQTKVRNLDDIVRRPISLESPETIKNTLLRPGFNKSKVLISIMAVNLLLSKGNRQIDMNSRPIIIFEDIESRLHPSLLLSLWSLIEPSDTQKIITTNSGDLLSAISLESLRRLQRRYYDTFCYKINRSVLNYEDLRRIAFHVRLNRPMALFARTWILVEGETEVWILTQIASILGISLPCEGIRIIEFAQCGIKPLIKIATQLGINFHVLTDGDEAGQKYSEVVKTFVSKKKQKMQLTVLPQRDIEHYLYSQGYKYVFVQAAGLANNTTLKKGITMDKIIGLAIRKKGKPGLALLLVDAIQKKGVSGIPIALARLLQTVRMM